MTNIGSGVSHNNTNSSDIEIADNIADSLRFKTVLNKNGSTKTNTINQTNNQTTNTLQEQRSIHNKNTSSNNEVNNQMQNNIQSDYVARNNQINFG